MANAYGYRALAKSVSSKATWYVAVSIAAIEIGIQTYKYKSGTITKALFKENVKMSLLNNGIGAVCSVIGSGAGAWVGAAIGALFTPVGAAIGATIGAIVGSIVGGVEGSSLSNKLFTNVELQARELEKMTKA